MSMCERSLAQGEVCPVPSKPWVMGCLQKQHEKDTRARGLSVLQFNNQTGWKGACRCESVRFEPQSTLGRSPTCHMADPDIVRLFRAQESAGRVVECETTSRKDTNQSPLPF